MGELARLPLAYLHLLHAGDETLLSDLRAAWPGVFILNRAGRDRARVGGDVAAGLADMESYGQWVLANPDFVDQVRTGAPFNAPRTDSFYGAAASGYTDYPTLAEMECAAGV